MKVNHWYNRRFSQWMDWFKKPYKKNSADFLKFDSLARGCLYCRTIKPLGNGRTIPNSFHWAGQMRLVPTGVQHTSLHLPTYLAGVAERNEFVARSCPFQSTAAH